jgi:hypothetical protein
VIPEGGAEGVLLAQGGQFAGYSFFINGQKVAEGRLPTTTPITFALSGEGLCCGWDSLSAASSAYSGPFRFTGRIKKVDVTLRPAATPQPPPPPAD